MRPDRVKIMPACAWAKRIKSLRYLLMPVLQDGREPGQKVFDGWGHLGHSNDIHNGLESP